MKRLALLSCFVLCFIVTMAQENYLPGYVVRSSNDTIRGYIDYRNWKGNPALISFKKTIDDAVFFYDPGHIAAFSVAGENYESATVETEISPEKLSDLSTEFEFKIKQETVFLQSLISGSKSLYYLLNNAGKDNFYVKRGDSLELLLYKKYTRTINGLEQVIENKKYLGQLNIYLNDCNDIQSKIATKRYNTKDLVKLFETYFECKSENAEFQKKADKITPQVGVLAGAMISSFSIDGEGFPYLINADYEISVNPTGGLFLTLVLPRNQGRFSIHNELLVTSYNIKGHHLEYDHENNYVETDITFKASHIKLNTMVQIKVPVKKVALRFEIGLSNAYALSLTAEKVQTIKFYADERTEKTEALEERKYEQGIVGGIGAVYNRLSFTTRYERASGPSETGIKTVFNRFYFIAGYRLNK